MQRREFIQTVGATAPIALAGESADARTVDSTAVPGRLADGPRVFFYDDGRHASPLYQFAPPLSPQDYVFTVDQLVGSGIDTLFYSAGLEGGVVQYDSRVAQKWGDNVDVWTHEIFYRASRNLHQIIADGHDPMQLLCDRCHATGLWFIPTAPVCILGTDRAKWGGFGRTSDFAYRTELQVGSDSDPQAKNLGRFFQSYRLNFLNPEVRQERFRIFEELLTRYESDGVELDLSLDNEFGPFCRFPEVDQLAPVLTKWIADLAAVARKAEQTQERRKQILIRIPAQTSTVWQSLGFEVEKWVLQELVDGLVCLSTNRPMLDQDLNLTAAVELTRGTRCQVLAGFEGEPLGRSREHNATPSMIRAAAANAYNRGADGFGLCGGMWAPDGWPWPDDAYQTLRILGHADMLATTDKIYRALSLSSGRQKSTGLFPPAETVLPGTIAEGESLEVPLRIGDDLSRAEAEGKVKEVRLRVHLANFEAGLNEAKIELNQRALPDSILQKGDLHFRVIKNTIAGPYGYLFNFLLPPELFPKQGDNVVRVTLLKRDPRLNLPVEVYDVDCSIQYRVHRHFERVPLDY